MTELRKLFHAINLQRKVYFSEILAEPDLNLMELELIVFLHEQPDSNTFTHIMKAKDYAKSHISTAINHLVQCGYIKKTTDSTNKKVHNLHLLDKSAPVIAQYYQCTQRFQENAFAGLDGRDLEIFQQVIRQINENLSEN